MTKFFQTHQLVDFDGLWLANAIHVVSGEIYQHDVLCPVFRRRQELGPQLSVLCELLIYHPSLNGIQTHTRRSFPSPYCTSDRVVVDLVVLDTT